MDEQIKDQDGEAGLDSIIALRSEENHMDPLFRFPHNDDLWQLFAHATLTEAMVVALPVRRVAQLRKHRLR